MKKPSKDSKSTLLEIIETESFQQYEKDCLKCSEGWQEVLPASIAFDDRYESDKRAYKEAFFDSKHQHDSKFNDYNLIKLLRRNYKKAAHPVFGGYRVYLKVLLQEHYVGENIPEQHSPYKKKHSLQELALVCRYNEVDISDDNFLSKLISEHGHTSIQKFRKHLNDNYKSSKRTNVEGARVITHKIKIIESIVYLLNEVGKKNAKSDLRILEDRIKN